MSYIDIAAKIPFLTHHLIAMSGSLATGKRRVRSRVICPEFFLEYAAWKKLQEFYDSEHSKIVLKDLFAQDPGRFDKFSRTYNSTSGPEVTMLVDLSKNLITQPVLDTLLDLAREARVEDYRDKMFTGEHINTSEDRAVLHVALRNFNDFKIAEDGVNEVAAVLSHMKEFSDAVRSGKWMGYTG